MSRLVRASTVAMALVTASCGGARAAEPARAASATTDVSPQGDVEAFTAAGRHVEAVALGRKLLADAERAHGPDSLEAAAAMTSLAAALGMGGHAARPETLDLARRAVTIRENALGLDHVDVAASLVELASVEYALGDLAAARLLLERAVGIHERSLGPDHPDVALSVSQLANLRLAAGEHAAARPLFERALATFERAHGPDHPRVATGLANLAGLLYSVGEGAAALPLFERAVAIQEKALGPDHADIANSVDYLAVLRQDAGDLAGARQLFERALGIRERALGPGHPDVGLSLNNLATLLMNVGELAAARPLMERSLAIREAALGAESPDVAVSLMNLGALLTTAGDFTSARPLLERSLAIRERALGPDHLDVATSLNTLAFAVREAGDPKAAIPLLERALVTWERVLGPMHPDVATSLNNLAVVLLDVGDRGGARAHLARAIAIREGVLGPDHPDLAMNLDNLAVLHDDGGDHAAARPLFERALRIREKAFGRHHPDVALSLDNLARNLAATGEPAAAIARALEAEAIGREHLRLTAATLSQREALRYAATRRGGLDVALSCLATSQDATQAAAVLDQLVRSRGVTLDVLAQRRRAVELAPDLEPLARARADAADRLATLTARGLAEDAPNLHAEALDVARAEMEEAERALAARSATFGADRQRAQVGLAQVRSSLALGETLVAYVRFTRRPVGLPGQPTPPLQEGAAAYGVFVLAHGAGPPAFVALGPAELLEEAVARWRVGVTTAGATAASGATLRRLAWDPVESVLGDTRRAIVVPDGALLSVPFGALPTDDGRHLVETAPTIAFLSAERDLVRDATATAVPAGLLALGGADFARAASGPAARLASAAVGRGAATPCPTFDTMRFDPLPATAGEAQDVARAWRRHARDANLPEETSLLVGASATEAAFKREAGQHRLLHVATHGFFLGSDCGPVAQARGLAPDGTGTSQSLPALAIENPLLRSGLALAGFNRRSEAALGEEDGVLTAEEIAVLDLSGVEWVVLSACETGLGEVQAGEGVLGLQRAFRIAGVRSAIISLWKVPDDVTRQLMSALYDARLSRGLDAAEAMREASLAVLRDRRARGESDSPYWWGGFVAAGR